MAVLFMDGFDADDFAMKWIYSGSVASSADTRFGTGKSIAIDVTSKIVKNINPVSNIYVGFAIKVANPGLYAGGGSYSLISVYGDNGATQHLSLSSASGGSAVSLYRGSTVLQAATIPIGLWFYLEMSATISDTIGAAVVKVNGNEVINFTGDTKNGGTNSTIDSIVLYGAANTSPLTLRDDLYISDSGFLGDVRVVTSVPTAAGSATDLTPTGGDNYANVADIPDSTATYNSSVTAGHKDLYTMGDIPASVSNIHAVQANNHAWKTDAGTKSLKNAIKSGTTTAYGATVSLPTSVAHHGDIFETDPDTSAAWTVSGVNGVEAGAEVA